MPVYYDISDVFDYVRYHSTVSGIQRVSLNILSRLAAKHGPDEIRVISWDYRKWRYLSYDASFFAGDFTFDRDRFLKHFAIPLPAGDAVRHWLARRQAGEKRGVADLARMIAPRIGRVEGGCDRGHPVQWRSGDVIFVPGATWGLFGYRAGLAEASRPNGVAVYQFIHDLIPLTASEHVIDGIPEKFAGWLDDLSGSVAGFIANSNATRADLQAWLDHKQRKIATKVVPLAHQFGLCGRTAALPDGAFAPAEGVGARVRNAARLPFALCVGTLESRKNLWSLVNAWRAIHARLGADTPRLVLAGSRGWRNDDFDEFMAGTGSLYGYIRVVDRPTDAELGYLYRHCLFSIFTSFKEGWGLPIGEALWFGRPVVCSNVSAMPEVGGRLADYADPRSIRSIEEAATRLIVDPAYREARAAEIAAATLRSWQDVADDLWAALRPS